MSGEGSEFENIITTKSGKKRDISVSYVPDFDEDDAVRGVFTLAVDITERKRDEEVLRQARDQLETRVEERTAALRDQQAYTDAILANMFDAIITIDATGKVGSFNRAAEETFGYIADEVVGQNISAIIGEPDRSRPDDQLRGYLETGRSGILGKGPREVVGRHKNGTALLLELTIGRIDSERGTLFVVSLRDISDRKRAESALSASDARLRNLVDMASDWFWEMDEELRFTWISDRVEEIIGIAAEWHYGKTRDEIGVSEVDPVLWREHLETLRRHEPYRDLLMHRETPAGSQWIRSNGVPTYDDEGRFTGYFGTGLDITKIVEAEKTIQANEAQLRLVTDNLPVLIVAFDRDCRYRYVNGVCEQWYARTLDEILGASVEEVLGRATAETFRPRLNTALEGRAVTFEDRVTYPDGITRDVQISYVPNIDPDGDVVGCFGLALDITERKAGEEAVLAAMEKAEIANRTKSDFLSNMSHELRTPLNAIIGFSEIIKQETLGQIGNAKYREYAGDINESGQHLLALIKNILDLSKVESGNDELYEEDIDVPETVRLIMRLSMGAAQMGNVDLVSEVPDGIPALRADASKVKQILINLLSNAVKFTPDGGKVTLKSWSGAESGYVFQVTDTGIGISSADIPKALAPFQQINSHLNRKHEGTGLGLPLTKSFVESHDGYLDVQSEVGIGTTVTVCFPAERIVRLPHDNGSRKRR